MEGRKIIMGIKEPNALTFEDLLQGKVKLEFGNAEHIRLIDAEQELVNRIRDNDLIEDDNEVMKEYVVEYAVAGTAIVFVDARNVEEAREKADYQRGAFDIEDIDYDYLETRLVGRV